jgi:BASS family bile acid:Na+ symporter
MPLNGVVPELVFTIVAAATVFTVMLDIGLGIVPREFRWVWRHRPLLLRSLFAVLVAVPVVALVVARAMDLPREADIGIVLMAISPGAPVALRRSLDAGGHRAFAPALQILIALLAVASMPLSIAALNEVYAGQASIAPGDVARQVLVAQLFPLALGIVTRRALPSFAARIAPKLFRLGSMLLLLLVVLAFIDVWRVVVDAGPRIVVAIVLTTGLALGAGHLLGGPDAGTRVAVAISGAARNAGLALLVATLNSAPPGIAKTVLVYVVISAATMIPYILWCRHGARVNPGPRSDGRGDLESATAERGTTGESAGRPPA